MVKIMFYHGLKSSKEGKQLENASVLVKPSIASKTKTSKKNDPMKIMGTIIAVKLVLIAGLYQLVMALI